MIKKRGANLLPFALAALSACASFGPGGSAHLAGSPAVFLNGFERAVEAGDWSSAKLYLDPAYLAEQHDEMLRGDTEQFFAELLSVGLACRNQKISRKACLTRIRSVRRVRTPGPAAEAGVPVRFRIELEGVPAPVRTELYLKLGPAPRKFSLFGPVG